MGSVVALGDGDAEYDCDTDSVVGKGVSNSKEEEAVVHIAEKFRLAFESQERRIERTRERLWRKQTREALDASGSERAIRQWEYAL